MEIRLNRISKIVLIVLSIIFLLCLFFVHPALARFRNRSITIDAVWTGEVSTSYRSGTGTIDNPYIISSGEELAYFSSQLESNDYENTYFKLINHIRINPGKFLYDEVVKYVLDNNTYYVHENHYYDNESFEGDPIGDINLFPSLNGFKGHLDGDSHIIYGLYLNSDNSGLFTNLSGDVHNLYLSNAMVIGNDSGILSNHITNGSIRDVMVDGYLVSDTVSDISNDLDYISNNSYTVSGGISAYLTDSSIMNCINKAEIYGSFISGGLVGYMENSSITNAYSTSNLYSHSSNTIGIIKGISSIDKIYNTGEMNGGLLGHIIDSTLTITNSFNTTDNYLALSVNNSTVTSNHNYYTSAGRGAYIDGGTYITDIFLQDKFYLTSYSEFVSLDDNAINPQNAWVFDGEHYPILYIDDMVNPYSELHIGSYTWNSYSNILETKKFTDNITFMITDLDDLHDYDKYYYISNSREAISKSALASVEWIPYTEMIQFQDEGFYVVYVKIVNGNDVTYMNSDFLILDKSLPTIDISIDQEHYNSVSDSTIYLDHSFTVQVTAEDLLSGVSSIEYYIGNDFLSDYNVTWIPYNSPISISTVGSYIVYVKVVDSCDYTTYASTPLIIFDGYVSSVNPLGSNSGNHITSNSSLVYHFQYMDNTPVNITHNLISSVVLPRYTTITLIDRNAHKVYGYTINSENDFGFETNQYATYPFTLFREKGKNEVINYVNQTVGLEQFDVILDFSRASISSDYDDVLFYINGTSNDEVIRTTIDKKSFSIESDHTVHINHSIQTDFSNTISYNSDSSYSILIHNIVQNSSSYDTNYFDKKIGLSIKLVDSNGRIMSSEHLKNFTFEVGNNKYIPSSDHIVRINLGTNSSIDTNLLITTHRCTPRLNDGTYYIKINAYSSLNGLFYDSVIDNGIMIPVSVSKKFNSSDYGFDVLMDSSSRIIDKDGEVPLSFTIVHSGLNNANIKVSLYQKDEVTAYNQDYTLIDLGDYIDSTLNEYIDSVYYVSQNPQEEENFSIQLDTTELDRTSYKFVFDLYDGTNLVGSLSKYIIIR